MHKIDTYLHVSLPRHRRPAEQARDERTSRPRPVANSHFSSHRTRQLTALAWITEVPICLSASFYCRWRAGYGVCPFLRLAEYEPEDEAILFSLMLGPGDMFP